MKIDRRELPHRLATCDDTQIAISIFSQFIQKYELTNHDIKLFLRVKDFLDEKIKDFDLWMIGDFEGIGFEEYLKQQTNRDGKN